MWVKRGSSPQKPSEKEINTKEESKKIPEQKPAPVAAKPAINVWDDTNWSVPGQSIFSESNSSTLFSSINENNPSLQSVKPNEEKSVQKKDTPSP